MSLDRLLLVFILLLFFVQPLVQGHPMVPLLGAGRQRIVLADVDRLDWVNLPNGNPFHVDRIVVTLTRPVATLEKEVPGHAHRPILQEPEASALPKMSDGSVD